MKRLVISAAVWLVAMTALPALGQNYPNFPPGMLEQNYGNVRTFSTTGEVSALEMQKYSKSWEVLNRVVLRGRYPGAIPTPARVYFITTPEARAIPAPYIIPQGYEFSGFYAMTFDGVVLNRVVPMGTGDVIHELLHRLFLWLGEYNLSVYRAIGGYHPMIGVAAQQAASRFQSANIAVASVLTEARLSEIWASVKGAEEFKLWPVQVIPPPHYLTIEGYYRNVLYPRWHEQAEQRLAMELASSIPNFFNRHTNASNPTFGAVVDYVEAIVEQECQAGCP